MLTIASNNQRKSSVYLPWVYDGLLDPDCGQSIGNMIASSLASDPEPKVTYASEESYRNGRNSFMTADLDNPGNGILDASGETWFNTQEMYKEAKHGKRAYNIHEIAMLSSLIRDNAAPYGVRENQYSDFNGFPSWAGSLNDRLFDNRKLYGDHFDPNVPSSMDGDRHFITFDEGMSDYDKMVNALVVGGRLAPANMYGRIAERINAGDNIIDITAVRGASLLAAGSEALRTVHRRSDHYEAVAQYKIEQNPLAPFYARQNIRDEWNFNKTMFALEVGGGTIFSALKGAAKVGRGLGAVLRNYDTLQSPIYFNKATPGTLYSTPLNLIGLRSPIKSKPELVKFYEKMGITPGKEFPESVLMDSPSEAFNVARDMARVRANLGDDALPFLQKIGPHGDNVYTGMHSPDKLKGWRIDYDPKDPTKGFHLNWWNRGGPKKSSGWHYGYIRIDSASANDYLDILSRFPRKQTFTGNMGQ